MKASDLVLLLQASIAERGDLPVHVVNQEWGDDSELGCLMFSCGIGDDRFILDTGPQQQNYIQTKIAEQQRLQERIAQQEAVFAQMRKEGRIL